MRRYVLAASGLGFSTVIGTGKDNAYSLMSVKCRKVRDWLEELSVSQDGTSRIQ